MVTRSFMTKMKCFAWRLRYLSLVISEAAFHVSNELKALYPEIPVGAIYKYASTASS